MSVQLPGSASAGRVSAHVEVLFGKANGKYPDGNSVVVRGSEGTVVIDPSLTVHALGGIGEHVDRVLISHAHEDHMAGLSVLQPGHIHVHHADVVGVRSMDGLMKVYGLPADDEPTWRRAVADDFHFIGWTGAVGFADGELFDLGGVTVCALHLPGHTRGHSAFLIEPDGVAFVGDIDLSSFGPYYGDHWSDLNEFISSIDTVRQVDAAHYVTFHHKGVVAGQADFVRQLDVFASVIDQRDDRLLALLAVPQSLDDLVRVGIVYRPGSRPAMFGESVERRTIAMHLQRLVAAGQVREDHDVFTVVR